MKSRLPPGLDVLVSALEERGFELRSDEGSDWPGRQLVFERHGSHAVRAVKLTMDRGLWDVEVRLGESLWVEPAAAVSDVEGRPPEQRAMSHDERRVAALAALDRLTGKGDELKLLRERQQQRTAEYNRWAAGARELPVGMRGSIRDRR